MSRLNWLVMGFLLGGATVFVSLKYHVLRTDQGFELVPKATATFSETYLDIRSFGLADWREHKTLLGSIMRSDKQYLLKDAATADLGKAVGGLMDQIGLSSDGS